MSIRLVQLSPTPGRNDARMTFGDESARGVSMIREGRVITIRVPGLMSYDYGLQMFEDDAPRFITNFMSLLPVEKQVEIARRILKENEV